MLKYDAFTIGIFRNGKFFPQSINMKKVKNIEIILLKIYLFSATSNAFGTRYRGLSINNSKMYHYN